MTAAANAPSTHGPKPVVSVIIPTYNAARWLEQTLRAVLAQTMQALEIIVVDDGSSDRSTDLARAVAPAARVLTQANAGVSAARNAGLAVAHGRYVIFLDQDDVWHPLQLERQVQWLESHPDCGAAVTPYRHWYPSGEAAHGGYALPATLWPVDTGLAVSPDFTGWVFHQFLFDCWALTSGTLLRRDLVLASGGFDVSLSYSEDWDLWLRLSQRTQFALLAWPPILYRQHPVQGSRAVRQRDFRLELLTKYARLHGLASRDGRAIDPVRFSELLAKYQFEFGHHHLVHGDRLTAVKSLFSAWRRRPRHGRRLALALAGALGWRPRDKAQPPAVAMQKEAR